MIDIESTQKENVQLGATKQLVVFSVENETFGVEILEVQEIIRMRDITWLPNTPDFVKGAINLRGNIIPVIDLREKFGLPPKPYTKFTRIIIVQVEDKLIGMIVDDVSEVVEVPEAEIEPPPEMVTGRSSEYIRGVAKVGDRLIIILELANILSTEEKVMLEEIKLPERAPEVK